MKENSNERDGMPQSSSCLYICQYCLVHLGDIARYRNQRKQAESFYRLVCIAYKNSGICSKICFQVEFVLYGVNDNV